MDSTNSDNVRETGAGQAQTGTSDADSRTEVRYEVVDHVAWITLDAPERMNTISSTMLRDISARMLDADRDRDVRCIVLTGEGRAFCAGLDMQAQMAGPKGGLGNLGSVEATPGEFELRDAPPIVMHALDTPTICALNGGAAGYGLDLALNCDIRIAADTAKLAPGFAKRGILPESGGTWLLPRMVGYARAAEIAFTGRTLLADEALELGLVNHVVPASELVKRAEEMAAEIAANAPLAVRAIKRMMRAAETETFEQNVHHVFLQLLPLLKTDDFTEGVTAFMEKRQPEFTGR
ncbi:enoyl-CoA hydratase/isomerase family protein [Ilumatobacter coccineus]|jgi:enoyl-CoA hydratase/carnithine racemase|uniref:Putative enoyl-CoA hydratase n=1 Tax=Ilumatobacter coccineus (strain NBRC 103263 / KCTC 29153 / YM16-304) TaxID=1313172 RepID=A0A6C7E8H2_ILUCY|nr:enoyl-CoA hydratase-related protein [Ilumatobacter coccineus]BAN02322.1 putative enoyl-CoA hydratase [Ilumatobacter coccineus YM16-304]